jgi:hypothetical protein
MIMGDESHASMAVGTPNSGVSSQSIVKLLGQEMVGGALSCTEMVCEHAVALLPQSSVAVQVRVVVYIPGQPPSTVLFPLMLISTFKSQSSVAMGTPKDGMEGHSTVVLDGQVRLGAVLSSTVTVLVQVLAHGLVPATSVRVYVVLQAPEAVTSTHC